MITLLDSDDYMSKDRYELVCKNIKSNDFLVNNLYTFSKKTPKPMLKISGKPILETILVRANRQGFSNFTISTLYFK